MHTDDEDQADFAALASKAKEAAQLRRWRPVCQHPGATVSLQPCCSVCGLVLPKDHPSAVAALKRIERMKAEATGPLAEVLGKVGR